MLRHGVDTIDGQNLFQYEDLQQTLFISVFGIKWFPWSVLIFEQMYF